MKRRKGLLKWLLSGWILIAALSGAWSVQAAQTTETAAQTTETEQTDGQWVYINGKYYWKLADGSIYKKRGLFKTGKYSYYLWKDGSMVTTLFRRINGKYYYFGATGKMYCPSKARFKTISGKTFYFYKDGHVATGRVKIQNKYYYFGKKGVLQKNVAVVTINSTYYATNEKGVMRKISATQVKCHQVAKSFISAHTSAGQTKVQKFRSCFRYMLAYMRFTPGYYKSSSDFAIIRKGEEGVYELALSMLSSPVLRGNCHRFAACVAVIAKELGYSPTMITTTGNHSFVKINGGYYDNMYGGLFGASSRPSYKVYRTTAL